MRNIVERLHEGGSDAREGADEIERLRDDRRMLLLCESDRKQMAAEIERMKEEVRKWQSIGQEVTARYGDEIERLRKLLDHARICFKNRDQSSYEANVYNEIRRALEGK